MKIECPNCNAAFEVEAKYVGGIRRVPPAEMILKLKIRT